MTYHPCCQSPHGRNVVPLSLRLRVCHKQSLSPERRRRPEARVLRQPHQERTPNQVPQVRKAGARSLHLKEAQALLSNLLDNSPHRASFEKHLGESRSNRENTKMGIELRSYGLRYEPRTAIKGQVLANFIANFTLGATGQPTNWKDGLNVDGASNSKGTGMGLCSPL